MSDFICVNKYLRCLSYLKLDGDVAWSFYFSFNSCDTEQKPNNFAGKVSFIKPPGYDYVIEYGPKIKDTCKLCTPIGLPIPVIYNEVIFDDDEPGVIFPFCETCFRAMKKLLATILFNNSSLSYQWNCFLEFISFKILMEFDSKTFIDIKLIVAGFGFSICLKYNDYYESIFESKFTKDSWGEFVTDVGINVRNAEISYFRLDIRDIFKYEIDGESSIDIPYKIISLPDDIDSDNDDNNSDNDENDENESNINFDNYYCEGEEDEEIYGDLLKYKITFYISLLENNLPPELVFLVINHLDQLESLRWKIFNEKEFLN